MLVERWTGTRATRIRDVYAGLSSAEHEARVLEDLQDRFPEARVVDYSIEGLERPLDDVVETTGFEAGRLGKRVGDLLLVEPGRIAYGVVPGRLPRPPRPWSFRAGLPRRESIRVALRAPAGWVPEALGRPVALDEPALAYDATWEFDESDSLLRFTRHAELRRAEITSEAYESFRDHVSALRAVDRQAVVFIRP